MSPGKVSSPPTLSSNENVQKEYVFPTSALKIEHGMFGAPAATASNAVSAITTTTLRQLNSVENISLDENKCAHHDGLACFESRMLKKKYI